MKWIGSILLLAAGLTLRQMLLRRYQEEMELGEELCQALDVLRQGIFRLRRRLPDLLRCCREKSRHALSFWDMLLGGIETETEFSHLWEDASEKLPQPYASLWRPVGRAAITGEQEELFTLTREETHRVAREKRQGKGEKDKLVTALCLSATLLVIVVLI